MKSLTIRNVSVQVDLPEGAAPEAHARKRLSLAVFRGTGSQQRKEGLKHGQTEIFQNGSES